MSNVAVMADVQTEVAALARQHGIAYAKNGLDALAQVITHLADDDVVTDITEDTLVALLRAHVIDGRRMVTLLGRYLDAKFSGV